jgi:hypothetical protein
MIAAATATGPSAPSERLLPFSSARNDYNLSMAGPLAVFARSDADFANAKIMVSERRVGRWAEPRPIAFSDPRYSDSDPWLTPDGKTLYFIFASARPGGKGGLDIYSAAVRGKGFAPAQPLAGPFNSAQSDSDFTLSRDGRLAAFWRGGGGRRAKIMIARRTAAGWSEPVALPDGINLGPFNFTPSFSRDGRRLTYASTAVRGDQAEGLADIFVADLPPMPK